MLARTGSNTFAFSFREIREEDVKKYIEDASLERGFGSHMLVKDAEQILYKQLQETNKNTQTMAYAQDFETWMVCLYQTSHTNYMVVLGL